MNGILTGTMTGVVLSDSRGARFLTVTLPGERPPSWNAAYAGQHWKDRQAAVANVRAAIRAAIDPDECEPFVGPVDVTVTVFFDKRPQDADNIPAKLYIDGLKGWWLADDDRAHVRSVRTVTELDPDCPRVVIELRAVQ